MYGFLCECIGWSFYVGRVFGGVVLCGKRNKKTNERVEKETLESAYKSTENESVVGQNQ